MPRPSLILFGLAAGLGLVAAPRPKGNGLLPTLQLPLTRSAANSCGGNSSVTNCHRISPFLTKVEVDVGQRVLARNQATTVTITGRNPGVAGTWGGFTADVTRGSLAAGSNTRTSAAGDAITHVNAFATGRRWTFGFKAPASPGLVELYTVVNAVNGNGRGDGGDEWGFFSAQILASQPTPVRLYTNADGVVAAGAGCADGYGNVPVLGAREVPRVGNVSCGQCHKSPPQGVIVTVDPALRVLPVNTSTTIKVSGSSAQTGSTGGFTADVTAGNLIAGNDTRTNAAGTAITQRQPNGRSWTFGYRAPANAGLAEFYVVSNHGNGNGKADPADIWAFHGADPKAMQSTPVRLYANAPGNLALGESCPDGFGNYSVLGSPEVPRVGNANYKLEAAGMAPNAPLLIMVGTTPALNVDLGFMGAAGCVLRTNMLIQALARTTPGSAARAEGTFVLPVPIPNQQGLKGTKLLFQFGYIDAASKRSFPFTLTNGLEMTVQ